MSLFTRGNGNRACWLELAFVATLVLGVSAAGETTPEEQRQKLSAYMNAIPPSKDYFCVGTGPANQALHPDRAPHTQLAQQDGVILFSGTAPQQGLNFQLNAGSLVYRNQMSTLGSPEPSPQVGAAGTLKQRPWNYLLPWSEARWHPGEDIVWQGYRSGPNWLGGMPYWAYEFESDSYCKLGANDATGCNPDAVYRPLVCQASNGTTWNIRSAINLQLARGIYQVSKVRGSFFGTLVNQDAESFREPWFQAHGAEPSFNVTLNPGDGTVRIAEKYFPTFHNIYTFNKLELDGGRMVVEMERSATWPRSEGQEVSGASMAKEVMDEYGNRVVFDRVPKYGWETDFKVPEAGDQHHPDDPNFSNIPTAYEPIPNAWRLPHKRLRTVQLFSAEDPDEPAWTIAFVYEHPESDRISASDTGPSDVSDEHNKWTYWKSLYSHLPQANWAFGRLPELNDETTLLTVQAYKGSHEINGAPFQDDYYVWGSTVGDESIETRARLHDESEGPSPTSDQ